MKLQDDALRFHAWGANVNLIKSTGKNPYKNTINTWKDLQDRRQTEEEVKALPWHHRALSGLGCISGPGGWRCIDIDGCATFTPVQRILDALRLPHNYPWVVRTGSGWHIWIWCKDDLPADLLSPKKDEPGVRTGLPKDGLEFDHLELRWERCQSLLPGSKHVSGGEYTWYHGEPDKPPFKVPVERVEAAVKAVCRPSKKAKSGKKSKSHKAPVDSPPREGLAEDLVNLAIKQAQESGQRNNNGLWLACQLRDNRFEQEEALEIGRCYVDTVAGDDPDDEYTFDEYEHSVEQAYSRDPRKPWDPAESAYTFDAFKAELEGKEAGELEELLLDLVDRAARLDAVDLRKAKMLVRHLRGGGFARDWFGAIKGAQQAGSEDRFTADKLAGIITSIHYFAQDRGGKLYRYAQGAYRDDGEEFVKRQVKVHLNEEGAADQWTSKLQSEVVEYIRVDAPQLWERPPRKILNLKNGLLELAPRTLKPHSPKYLSQVQFPVTYDPAATCSEIDKWTEETLEPEDKDLLAEVAAWAMMPDNPADQALMLRGAGGNGKSIFLSIILAFLGRLLVAAVSLQKLTTNRFAANRLVGKVANICPDLPSAHLAETDMFKRITGGDPVNTEYKHGKDFDFMPHCKLLFSANETPTSSDVSEAYFRRWVIASFNKKFEGEKRIKRVVLLKRLTTPDQLSGLLNKALDRWDQVAEYGISVSENMKQAHLKFMEQSSPITAWLGEHVVRDADGIIECSELIDAYKEFARQNRHPLPSAKEFGNKVRQFHPAVNVVLRYPEGATVKRTKHYAGLRWAEDFGEPLRDTDDTDTDTYCTGEENRAEKREAVVQNSVKEKAAGNGCNGITPGDGHPDGYVIRGPKPTPGAEDAPF